MSFAIDSVSASVPGNIDAIFRLHEPWAAFEPLREVHGLQLHSNTRAALELCDVWVPGSMEPATASCM